MAFLKLKKPVKDDPRLSRGLQLLQSKIAILEDLSDRTDTQVKQLSKLLDQKGKAVQEMIQASERQIQKIHTSIEKSLDVAKIFGDKIPHEEIVERQNTIKYVKAARMANQGYTLEEIVQKVEIPRNELEFIYKVNKEKLMFSEEDLPDWVRSGIENETHAEDSVEESNYQENLNMDISDIFKAPQIDIQEDLKIQQQFKQACEEEEKLVAKEVMDINPHLKPSINTGPSTKGTFKSTVTVKPDIEPIEFKKITKEELDLA